MAILLNHPVPEEGIHHQEPNTTAYIKNKEIGKGTLYITESVFCWVSNNGEGFSVNYPSMYIHAVSRDVSTFPHPCLFVMIEGDIEIGEGAEETVLVRELNSLRVNEENMDGNDYDEEEHQPSTDMKFVPENPNMLEIMFQAVTDCQALNPDPAQASDDDDGDGFANFNFNIQNGVVEVEWIGVPSLEDNRNEENEDLRLYNNSFE